MPYIQMRSGFLTCPKCGAEEYEGDLFPFDGRRHTCEHCGAKLIIREEVRVWFELEEEDED